MLKLAMDLRKNIRRESSRTSNVIRENGVSRVVFLFDFYTSMLSIELRVPDWFFSFPTTS